MFGIGMTEGIVITLVALIVLGPKRAQEIAHRAGAKIGRLMETVREFSETNAAETDRDDNA